MLLAKTTIFGMLELNLPEVAMIDNEVFATVSELFAARTLCARLERLTNGLGFLIISAKKGLVDMN